MMGERKGELLSLFIRLIDRILCPGESLVNSSQTACRRGLDTAFSKAGGTFQVCYDCFFSYFQ